MTKAEKTVVIEELVEKLTKNKYFYLTDYETMTVEKVNKFRRACFEKNIEVQAVKNSLIRKAMQQISETEYTGLYDSLKGATAILFAEDGKAPALLLKEFRKKEEKPLLKGAYIESSIFIGDDQIEDLTKVKSKADLLGELLGLLQSPMMTLMGQLNYGKNTIGGLLKTLEEREEAA